MKGDLFYAAWPINFQDEPESTQILQTRATLHIHIYTYNPPTPISKQQSRRAN